MAILPVIGGVVAAAAATGGIITPVVLWARRYQQRLLAAWTGAAEAVGGQFTPQTGPWYNKQPMNIRATLDDSEVFVDSYVVSTGKSSVTYTRLRAPAPGATLHLKVYKENFFSSMGKALGTQDVQVGDPAFDETFIVKASDEDLARAWLSYERARRYISLALPYTFEIKNGTLTVIRVGMENDQQRLEHAIRATAALAAGGRRLLAKWRRAAGELGAGLVARGPAFELDGGTALETESRGIHVLIDAPRTPKGFLGREHRLYTRVRARLAGNPEPFAIYTAQPPASAEGFSDIIVDAAELSRLYTIRAQNREAIVQKLSPDVCHRIARVAPEAVISDAQFVDILFPGVETNPPRLKSAVELAAELASASTRGPYR